MPTVKVQAGPSVAPQTVKAAPWSADVPRGAFDKGAAGLIAGGQKLMEASDRIGAIEKAQNEQDAKTLALDTQLRAQNDIRAAQNDFMSRKGLAANGVYKDAETIAKDIMDGYASELQSNARAQELFKASFSPHMETFLNGMNNHQRTEMDKAFEMGINTRMEDARRTLAENYKTPGAYENFRRDSEILVREKHPTLNQPLLDAEGNPVLNEDGTPKDANTTLRANLLREQISKGQVGVVSRMLVNDPPQAVKAYFDKHKGDFVGEDLVKVEARMKPYLEMAQVQSVLDKTQGQGLSARLAAIKSEYDKGSISPEVRSKAEEKAKGDYHLAVSMSHEADYQYGKKLTDDMTKAFQRGDIAGAEKLAMTAGRGQALHAQQLLTQMKSGALTATDPKTEWELTQLAANDPAKFRQEWNPLKYGTQLNAKDLNKFDSIYLSIGKGDDKVIDDIRTDAARVAEAAMALGIKNVKEASEEEQAKLGLFSRAFQQQVDEHIQKTGKKPTPQEKDAMVDRLLLKGTVKGSGWIWDDTARVFEGRSPLTIAEPKRPEGMPTAAVWDSSKQGWVMNGKVFPYRVGVK